VEDWAKKIRDMMSTVLFGLAAGFGGIGGIVWVLIYGTPASRIAP
jgi:hypothetical protein